MTLQQGQSSRSSLPQGHLATSADTCAVGVVGDARHLQAEVRDMANHLKGKEQPPRPMLVVLMRNDFQELSEFS